METKKDSSLDQNLLCEYCKEMFNLNERLPLILSCGHTACNNCYDFKLKQPQKNKIKCPF